MSGMANEAMKQAWDGDEGDHWAAEADHYDAASARVVAHYLPAIGVQPGDRVLDIGSGAGGLALALAASATGGVVVGIDLSSKMVDVAAKRAAERGITNADFIEADAQTTPLGEGFDLAVSSFGVMFFDDPVAAFSNIGRALRPGGRACFLAWQPIEKNPWLMGIRTSLAMGRDLPLPPLEAPTPFALSVPARTRSLLAAAGFTDVVSDPIHAPMVLGADTDDAFDFFKDAGLARGLAEDLDEQQRRQGFANLHRFLAAHETPEGVLIDSAAWVISARWP